MEIWLGNTQNLSARSFVKSPLENLQEIHRDDADWRDGMPGDTSIKFNAVSVHGSIYLSPQHRDEMISF